MAKRSARISLSQLVDGPEASPAPAEPERIEPAAAPASSAEPEIVDALARSPSKLEQVAGVVPFVIHISPEDKRRLRILAAETGLKFQDIGIEGISMFLRARGLPGLERVKASVPDGRKKR